MLCTPPVHPPNQMLLTTIVYLFHYFKPYTLVAAPLDKWQTLPYSPLFVKNLWYSTYENARHLAKAKLVILKR